MARVFIFGSERPLAAVWPAGDVRALQLMRHHSTIDLRDAAGDGGLGDLWQHLLLCDTSLYRTLVPAAHQCLTWRTSVIAVLWQGGI